MKEALYYKKEKEGRIRCQLCPHNCLISEGKTGICGVRKNIKGKLYSLVYEHPIALNIDPIEKKPLFHFLPDSKVLSFGTVGCNLQCKFCQNWQISQVKPKEDGMKYTPLEIVDICKENDCKSIAYTYTEPTIFYEYMLETAKIARTEGIKNIIVSNGFINEAPLKELCRHIDAANIDLKSFKPDFYTKICKAKLAPVLKSLKILKKNKVWVEVTVMIIPGYNDSEEEIKQISDWIKKNLGEDTPLHLSKFFPHYKMKDVPPTKEDKLLKLREVALNDLKYVYVGNMRSDDGENTYCPKCGKLLVGRSFFGILSNKIREGKCICGKKIPGIWD